MSTETAADHTATGDWSNGYYRATCSCGKYRSRRYLLIDRARRAWDAHVRAVTRPHGCIRLREEAE
jgi:hypothetical protein